MQWTEWFAIQFFFFFFSPRRFQRYGKRVIDFFFFLFFFLLSHQFRRMNFHSCAEIQTCAMYSKCDCAPYMPATNFRETHPVFTGAIKIPIFTKLIALLRKALESGGLGSSGFQLARRSGEKSEEARSWCRICSCPHNSIELIPIDSQNSRFMQHNLSNNPCWKNQSKFIMCDHCA